MESGVGENVEYKLFIGGLARSIDNDGLFEAFKDCGEIPFCKVCVDRESGDSRGFGFVCYTSKADANAAVKAMDGSTLDGRRLSVKPAEDPSDLKAESKAGKTMPNDDSCKLFVRCLAWGTDDVSLRTAFEAFGTVVYCRVQTDRDSGRSRGFGFVCFGSADEATAALEMDQADLDGRTINVVKALPKSQSTPYKAPPAAVSVVEVEEPAEAPAVADSATDGDEEARRKQEKKEKKQRKKEKKAAEEALAEEVVDEKAAKKTKKAAKKEAKLKKRKAEEPAEEVIDEKAAKKARKAAKKAKKQ